MSTNKTTNYQLHSWLPTDEFHLTEINENFDLLDTALKAEAGQRVALANSLNGSIRMVTGIYTGLTTSDTEAQATVQINLGFKPKAVLVMATEKRITGPLVAYLAIVGGQTKPAAVTITATGFIARNDGAYANYMDGRYHYAAFY